MHPAGRAPGAGGRGDPGPRHPAAGSAAADGPPAPGDPAGEFDWQRAEADLGHLAPPAFLGGDDLPTPGAVDRAQLRLADVGGMDEVKARLDAAFLAPLRSPDLRRPDGKSLRGGLLLYGPPGCGKTFLARAVAGELGAGFLAVSLADVLDMYIGRASATCTTCSSWPAGPRPASSSSTRSTPSARSAPTCGTRACGRRSTSSCTSSTGSAPTTRACSSSPPPTPRGTSIRSCAGPGARPHPAGAAARQRGARGDPAPPPADRPVAGVDLRRLAALTEGLSGADLAHMCETAAERALLDSARTGAVRMIGMADLEAGLGDVQPSTGPWFHSARNVALSANEGGQYDELPAYLKKRRLV